MRLALLVGRQADAAQLGAVASNVSAEQYPHAARWYKHGSPACRQGSPTFQTNQVVKELRVKDNSTIYIRLPTS